MCTHTSSPEQELYAEDPRVWNAIFELIVQDFKKCQLDGVPVGSSGDKIFPIILGNKGDWSYLETWRCFITCFVFIHEAMHVVYISRFFFCVCVFWTICSFKSIGSFSWEFITVEDLHAWCATKVGSANLERSYRRAPKGAGQGGDFQVEGGGVCHLCLCGQGTDWENLTL